MAERRDAVVVGAGPNGLAAAITLAERGLSVHVVEAADVAGGGCRTDELTLPGFHHDVGASVLPFGTSSRFFAHFAATSERVEFVHPAAPLAHPFEDRPALLLERSVDATASALGADAARYRRVFDPLVRHAATLVDQFLGPLRPPRHPLESAAFGLPALAPAALLSRALFHETRTRALFAGMAAHSMMSPDSVASSSVGLVLGMVAHAVGWPVVRGGSGALTDRAGAASHLARRHHRDRTAGRCAQRPAPLARAGPRPRAARHRGDRRRRAPGRVPPPPASLPVRPGDLQARLGARRADPVVRRALRARRHRARRRRRSPRSSRPSAPLPRGHTRNDRS